MSTSDVLINTSHLSGEGNTVISGNRGPLVHMGTKCVVMLNNLFDIMIDTFK